MKHLSKIFLLLFLFCLRQAFPVFAQGETVQSVSQSIQEILMAFLYFLSWAWVIPATIAGKLMTNEFVYGEAIHMANFMRRVRNIMRSFANYAIGFIFLYNIFKVFFDPKAEVSKLKDVVFNVVTAVLLINISWFAIAAMVDLSIVGVAAVGSMPAQVLETRRDSIKHTFIVPKEFTISRDNTKLLGYSLESSTTGTVELGDILPQADDISGPLFFLGVSVFNMLEVPYIDPEITTWSTITLDSFLSLFIILLFTIPLIVLTIVNMMRIFRLRIWIMLSPIIALDRAFTLKLGDHAEGEKAKKLFNPSELAALIFQPVVTVAALSLCLILIIGIRQVVIGGSEQALSEIQKILCLTVDSSKESTVGCEGVSFVKIIGSGFGSEILHLLLALLASFLLRQIVKLSFSFSGILSGVASGLYSFAQGALGAIPIPGTGGLGATAAMRFKEQYQDIQEEKLLKHLGRESSNKTVDRIMDKVTDMAGIPTRSRDFTKEETNRLKYARNDTSKPKLFLTTLKDMVQTSPKQFGQVKQELDTRLGLETTQKWFTTGEGRTLRVTSEMFSDGKIYDHPQFQGFIDTLLRGSAVENAITQGARVTRKLQNMENNVYPIQTK